MGRRADVLPALPRRLPACADDCRPLHQFRLFHGHGPRHVAVPSRPCGLPGMAADRISSHRNGSGCCAGSRPLGWCRCGGGGVSLVGPQSRESLIERAGRAWGTVRSHSSDAMGREDRRLSTICRYRGRKHDLRATTVGRNFLASDPAESSVRIPVFPRLHGRSAEWRGNHRSCEYICDHCTFIRTGGSWIICGNFRDTCLEVVRYY